MESTTKQTRVIFPADLNNHGTLFGGRALMWMDEVAYITVLRYARTNAVTISVNKLKYLNAINAGDIIELTGIVTNIGAVKITVHVEIYREQMDNGNRQKAIEADFAFALINDEHKAIPVRNIRK